MRAEVSSLFYIIDHHGVAVQDARSGGGVHGRQLEPEWIEEVKRQCPKVKARELLERHHYTHRLFMEVPFDEGDWNYENEVTKDEMQSILRAIALSRIVKPTAIA